jgi:hypothetical protein
MGNMHFDSHDHAATYISEALTCAGIEPKLSSRIASEVLVDFQTRDTDLSLWSSDSENRGALLLSRVSWAIRDDELKGLADVAILVCGFLGHPDVNVVTAALIVRGVCFLNRIRQKGVQLSPLQNHVLMVLKDRPAASLDALTQALPPRLGFCSADVQEALNELKAIRQGDGTVCSLVAEDADHRWSAAGV